MTKMLRNLFLKTVYNLRWQAVGWTCAVMFVAFITMVLFTSLSQNGIEQLVGSIPESLRPLIGSVDDFTTIPGYIGQQIFGPNVIIVTVIMSILLFLGVSANEENDGRLQSLLSFPITRSSVYFQKWLAVMLIIGIVCLSIVAALWVGLLIVNETADYARILQSVLDAWIMNVAYGMVVFSVAMATGKKGLAIAIASGYAFVSFVITSLAPSVDSLDIVDKFSIFHYYNLPQIMQNGLDMGNLMVLIGIVVALTIVGWLGFLRRDVRSS